MSLRSFDGTRHEMIETQRRALMSCAVEEKMLTDEVDNLERFGSTTVHLNSIWREKYAFAAGEAKATKLLFDQLCAKVPSAK